MEDEIIGLSRAAKELGISSSTASKKCPTWGRRGVRILTRGPRCQKRFFLSDIVKMRDGIPR